MARRVLFALVLAALGPSLSGCGDGTSTRPSAGAAEPPPKRTGSPGPQKK